MESLKEIGLDSIVSQSVGLVAADLDGQKVMLNIDKGKYYGLDDIGSRIWVMIEKPRAVREIVTLLQNEYNVDDNTCRHDVLAFLNKLHNQGLVAVGKSGQ